MSKKQWLALLILFLLYLLLGAAIFHWIESPRERQQKEFEREERREINGEFVFCCSDYCLGSLSYIVVLQGKLTLALFMLRLIIVRIWSRWGITGVREDALQPPVFERKRDTKFKFKLKFVKINGNISIYWIGDLFTLYKCCFDGFTYSFIGN